MDKAEQLQRLLDLTVEAVNDLAIIFPELSALELFQEAVSEAIEQCQNETQIKKYNLPIGKVDTKNVAFSLQDNETAAVIQGSHDFAADSGFDTIGGDETESIYDDED